MQDDWLAKRFDENRAQLRAVALRMLGSATEADDAVQEAWLKVARSDSREVENLGGWLRTVVARICLDMLRSRKSEREQAFSPPLTEMVDAATPEAQLGLADAMGPALLVVLDMLAPAERVAFVLHDLFDLSFEEIAPIVERTPDAARQLASRARRRIRGAAAPVTELAQHRELVSAFFAAAHQGNFERLLAVLSPDVVLRADELAVSTASANPQGAPKLAPEIRGAQSVADAFNGRSRGASPALIDGNAGAVWAVAGQVRVAFVFVIEAGRIAEIELMMDPTRLAELDVEIG